MADSELPIPLTPADCNLQDFEFMPVMIRRLLKSDTWTLGNGDERAAAVALWFESWHQIPAASLPTDDRLLRKLADSPKWPRVKEQAMRNWVLCRDGRYYHAIVAEKALEAWIEKLLASVGGAQGNAKRWQVTVDTTADLDRLLTSLGMLKTLNPKSRTFKKKSVMQLLQASPPEPPSPSPPDGSKVSPPDTTGGSPPDGGESSPPDRNRQGQGQREGLDSLAPPPSGEGAAAPVDPPPPAPSAPPPPPAPAPIPPAPPPPKVKAPRAPAAAKPPAPTNDAWEAYRAAYVAFYEVEPLRNATVNGQLAALVGRVGAENAVALAGWYVSHRHRLSLYANTHHKVGLLLRDCEGLFSQMQQHLQGIAQRIESAPLSAKAQRLAEALPGLAAAAAPSKPARVPGDVMDVEARDVDETRRLAGK